MKGATSRRLCTCNDIHVSIHAPVKGATCVCGVDAVAMVVSIHAPVKGATMLTKEDRVMIIVSIHAPVKGATSLG